jgi:hypothetical protein
MCCSILFSVKGFLWVFPLGVSVIFVLFAGGLLRFPYCSLIFNHIEVNILLICERLYFLFIAHEIVGFPVSQYHVLNTAFYW